MTSNVYFISVVWGATASVLRTIDVNADGIGPTSNFIQGSDEIFYGTTYNAGANNLDIVFQITPAGVESGLHAFAREYADGSFPAAA